MLTLTLLVHLEYYFIRPYRLEHFFSLDLVVALIFMLLLNVVYVSLYYYDLYLSSQTEKQALAQKLEEKNRRISDHFIVKVGKRDIIIPFGQILCFYSQEKETFLLTSDHKIYLVDLSLEKIEEELSENDFFRANRKFIITPSLIESIHTENHGKLSIQLKPYQKIPANLIISREKAPAFRKWMKR
jgi:DNA-binding LytR/AlgR family response regulator